MKSNVNPLSLVWLRRDLRLNDHAALYHALQQPGCVQPVFVFDSDILARFPDPGDRRLTFIAQALCEIDAQLRKRGGGLLVAHGKAEELIPQLAEALGAARVFAAEDYEPGARARDQAVSKALSGTLSLVKDQVIFSPAEILKENGEPYKVFTPYANAWRARLMPASGAAYAIDDSGRYADFEAVRARAEEAGVRVLKPETGAKVMLADIGYREQFLPLWPVKDSPERLQAFISAKVKHYRDKRDRMGEEGTSRLSPYLRFGLVSVRECLRGALKSGAAHAWLNELIWREFYAMILYHFPESAHEEWNPIYRGTLGWSQDGEHLAAWKEGKTGFPLIDAAMRELATTGWMHNRARMIVASFLTKDLLLDWRLGEAHFAQLLMDYDMASNVGGWQWAASTGTDAQPYFRIFNPLLQSKKFDPEGTYIRRYVPELKALDNRAIHQPGGLKNYPAPIVDHAESRAKALAMFKRAAANPPS